MVQFGFGLFYLFNHIRKFTAVLGPICFKVSEIALTASDWLGKWPNSCTRIKTQGHVSSQDNLLVFPFSVVWGYHLVEAAWDLVHNRSSRALMDA